MASYNGPLTAPVLSARAPKHDAKKAPPPANRATDAPDATVAVDAPDSAGQNLVWDVDVLSARLYLKDLLNQMAQPEQARITSFALTQMNVQGSLLRPHGVAGQALGSVQIERADLRESYQPGTLRIRGVMSALESLPNAQTRAVRWRVQADFKGTAQGTVLTLLDLNYTE